MIRHALTASVLLAAFAANAKTPGEVYEQAAKSTVVVRNIDSSGKPKGMGSGVVLPDRNVVTNCHVVKGASKLTVRIGTKEYPANLRYSDWDRDVCSLNVAGMSAPAVVVGSTKTLKVGAKVYAIGAPKGLELTLSDGIVSSLREVEGGQYIQTTAAISPGSSGGGLFDENGALVGLTTFYLAEGQNLNFAVPVEWVKELPKRNSKLATIGQTETQWLNKLFELEGRKNWPALIEHSLNWIKTQPERAKAWYMLGIAYSRATQFDKAIEAFQQALRINPENAASWKELGDSYANAGQAANSIEAYHQALRVAPEYAASWINLGASYAETNEIPKAINALQQGLSIDPQNENAWYVLGVLYGKIGQDDKATDAYQQVVRINPEYAMAWNNLGTIYGKAGRFSKAIDALQQCLRINPEYAKAWFNLGMAYDSTGQRDKVIEVYKRLKTIDPIIAEQFFRNFVMP